MRNYVLVVIEAPGKISSFSSILDEVLNVSFKVIATKGRLFDMPDERPGLNHSISINDLVQVNADICDTILHASKECDYVLIMTDNDIEGEVIAYQASTLIASGKPCYRIRFNSISPGAISKAIAKKSHIDTGMVSSGIAKRLYDYTIGKSVSPEHLAKSYGVTIGSVVSPLLNRLSLNYEPIGIVSKEIRDISGEEWRLNVPFYPGEKDQMESVSEYLSGVSVACIIPDYESDVPDLTCPMTGPMALQNLSLATGRPVLEIDAALQRLYQKGEVSYPRTDSYYLSQDTSNQLKSLADHFGVDGFDSKFLHSKCVNRSRLGASRASQDAHEAIHVLGENLPLYSSTDDLHMDDQVKVLLARDLMRSGQIDRRLKVKKGRLESSIQNKDLFDYLSPYLDRLEISQGYSYRVGLKRQHVVDPVTKPFGISIGIKLSGGVRLIEIPNDVRVLMALEALGIGRPSTVAHHSGRISSKYINQEGFVNKKGDMAIITTKQLVPNLLKKEPQEMVDLIINNVENKELNYDLRVSKALSVMGIRTTHGDGASPTNDLSLPYGLNA